MSHLFAARKRLAQALFEAVVVSGDGLRLAALVAMTAQHSPWRRLGALIRMKLYALQSCAFLAAGLLVAPLPAQRRWELYGHWMRGDASTIRNKGKETGT